MHRKDAIAWVVSVCSGSLRLSQAKTLSILAAAAMRVQRVSLANIGRMMDGAAKHQIKRCWRFCANERVEPADAMRGIVARLLKKRKKKLLVAVDWVDIKGFQTLVASVVLKGRSTPIAWASTANHVYDGHRSRNALRGIAAAGAARHDPADDQGRDPGRPRLWTHRPGHVLPAAGIRIRDPHPAVGHGPPARLSRQAQAAGLPGL